MITSVYLSNNNIQVLLGENGKSGGRVKQLYNVMIREGNLMNGVITNDVELGEEINRIWKLYELPKTQVSLVIDSTHFITKLSTIPKLNDKKTMEIVRKEFSDMENLQDPLYDYMLLGEEKGGRMARVMCAATERSFVGSFMELFERLGIGVTSVKPALCSEVKLLSRHEEMMGETCIVQLLDGDNLVSALLVNGQYTYSSRARLFSEHGTGEFALEVGRNASAIMQFSASEKNKFQITDVYFGGFLPEDLELCMDSVRSLGLQVGMFPESGRIQMPAAANAHVELKYTSRQPALCDYIYPAGNFI